MNEFDIKIMGLYTRIDKNNSMYLKNKVEKYQFVINIINSIGDDLKSITNLF